ncbi:hypothetical protein [Caldimonas tepidiphila]|uniref:hypothetical protein n=1 Tax=Caldimonas tepidiphila TaxID=2315841 RepID=UPI0013001BBD|nr:hypothetical protein [Caldimonas tepidiphila]
MKPWSRVIGNALISGNAAGLASMAALAIFGRKDAGSVMRPINAPSHWLHGDRGTRQDGISVRYTLPGVLTHQLSAVFWAMFFERLVPDRPEHRSPPALLGHAAVGTAVAALVDLKLVPRRLTPGFEQPLRSRSLWWVYSCFALGLAAGSHWASHRHSRTVERRVTPRPDVALPPAVSTATQHALRHPGQSEAADRGAAAPSRPAAMSAPAPKAPQPPYAAVEGSSAQGSEPPPPLLH